MPRFFTQTSPASGRIPIEGDDARHIVRVLRMKAGERLVLCDSAGTDYQCEIETAEADRVVCRVLAQQPSAGEPSAEVTLFMALPKGDKFEFIVQKAVELGAVRIVPFLSARCVSRPDGKSLLRKTERWRKIAAEAAKQCGRGRIPEVAEPLDFPTAVQAAAEAQTALFFYECEQETSLRSTIGGKTLTRVSLMIGPEGGFALDEAQHAAAAGLTSVSLGRRILRCETAPLAALAAVMYESGNF